MRPSFTGSIVLAISRSLRAASSGSAYGLWVAYCMLLPPDLLRFAACHDFQRTTLPSLIHPAALALIRTAQSPGRYLPARGVPRFNDEFNVIGTSARQ